MSYMDIQALLSVCLRRFSVCAFCVALRPLSDQLALATPRTDVSSEEELSSPIFSSPVSQRDLTDVDISRTLAATLKAQATLRNAPQV